MIKILMPLVLGAATALACGTSVAETFPARPVRLIVPFPAGGPADLFGRALAQGMSAFLGQPVVVENRGGVGGVLGIDVVAKAAPDGYIIGLNSASTVAIAPYSMMSMPYDAAKDLALITTVVKVPEVLVAHPSLPVTSMSELVAYAKSHPGKINFGSAGAGSITHLAGELLKVVAQVDMVHVPYKGAAPAVTELLAGQVQIGIFDVPVVLPHIVAGKLRPLAVTSAKRAASLPQVMTTAEAGYPKVVSDNWYGLVAPARTAPPILARLHEAAVTTLGSARVAEQFASVSGERAPSTPEAYGAFLAEEQAKWRAIVRAIDFKQ